MAVTSLQSVKYRLHENTYKIQNRYRFSVIKYSKLQGADKIPVTDINLYEISLSHTHPFGEDELINYELWFKTQPIIKLYDTASICQFIAL